MSNMMDAPAQTDIMWSRQVTYKNMQLRWKNDTYMRQI